MYYSIDDVRYIYKWQHWLLIIPHTRNHSPALTSIIPHLTSLILITIFTINLPLIHHWLTIINNYYYYYYYYYIYGSLRTLTLFTNLPFKLSPPLFILAIYYSRYQQTVCYCTPLHWRSAVYYCVITRWHYRIGWLPVGPMLALCNMPKISSLNMLNITIQYMDSHLVRHAELVIQYAEQ